MHTSAQPCNYKTIFKQCLHPVIQDAFRYSDTSQNFCGTEMDSLVTYSYNR